MFTEEEKNEIVAYVKEGYHYCPFPHNIKYPKGGEPTCSYTGRICKIIFPKVTGCACNKYPEEYVKDKFWKAMEI